MIYDINKKILLKDKRKTYFNFGRKFNEKSK